LTDHDLPVDFEDFDTELPEPPSALQMLIDASPAPDLKRKRASSCPPAIEEVDMQDLTSKITKLDVTEPKSDPIVPISHEEDLITAENAQTLLDPNACLFVAK